MQYALHLARTQETAHLAEAGAGLCRGRAAFDGATLTFEDKRRDYGERRWVTMGLLREKVIVVVHTETEDEIRVIPMREAEKDEQLLFFANL